MAIERWHPVHPPRHGMHQWILIPCSRRYNYKISMRMVSPEGLEPSTKGFPVGVSLD